MGNNKAASLFLWCVLYVFSTTQGFSQSDREKVKVKFVVKENGTDAVHFPLFDTRLQPIAVTDSVGTAEFSIGDSVLVRSLFFRDTAFVVIKNHSLIEITPSTFELEEVQIKSYSADELMGISAGLFIKGYSESPFMARTSGYYYFKGREKFLEFYQMDGLTLFSGNKKWKAWSFAPGGKPESYLYMVPINARRSFHWDYEGDSVGYTGYDRSGELLWIVKPFMYRPIYRALEISGPMFPGNKKFYEFVYNYDEETEEDYVVNFRTRERYRNRNVKDLFLVGEGKVFISKSSNQINRVEFDFSKYYDVNLERSRAERKKDIAGKLTVGFIHGDRTYPSSVEFNCQFLGENWFLPRPAPVVERLNGYENVRFTDYTTDLVNDNERETYRIFDFMDMESYAEYDPVYWQKNNALVGRQLYNNIQSGLSTKIPLDQQFVQNSGSRLAVWQKGKNNLMGLFPNAASFDEAAAYHKDLVLQYREGPLTNIFHKLR